MRWCDGHGRPVIMLLSDGQMSDYTGTKLMRTVLPPAKYLLADWEYDADLFRKSLINNFIYPCIPPRKSWKKQIEYEKTLYKQRHKIETMFGKIKDWRRIALRYDQYAYILFSTMQRSRSHLFFQFMSPEPRAPWPLWESQRG